MKTPGRPGLLTERWVFGGREEKKQKKLTCWVLSRDWAHCRRGLSSRTAPWITHPRTSVPEALKRSKFDPLRFSGPVFPFMISFWNQIKLCTVHSPPRIHDDTLEKGFRSSWFTVLMISMGHFFFWSVLKSRFITPNLRPSSRQFYLSYIIISLLYKIIVESILMGKKSAAS